jgi:hypothetical protein
MATLTAGGNLLKDNDQVRTDTGDCSSFSAVAQGAFVGTITFQVLYDNGEGWVSAACFTRLRVSVGSTLTAPGGVLIDTIDAVAVRALMHPYTSGSPEVTFAGMPGVTLPIGGGGGGGGGGPVTAIANAFVDGWDQTSGTTADAPITTVTTGSTPATKISLLRGLVNLMVSLISKFPAALVGGRFSVDGSGVTQPVSGTFFQATQPVSAASLPLPTGAAQDTTLATTNTEVGGLTETVPATDVASSGLNGRLQRIAQRLTSLIALLPAALVNGALVMTGDTASGVTDAGNPVKMGGLAVAHGTNPTAVAAGQRANQAISRQGLPYVIPGHPNILTSAVTFTTAQTNTVLVSNSAGTKIILWAYSVKTSDANTVDVSARLGIAASVVPADSATGLVDTHPNIAAGSGFAGGPGIMGIGADAEQLLFTCSAPTGGSCQIAYKWYVVPS